MLINYLKSIINENSTNGQNKIEVIDLIDLKNKYHILVHQRNNLIYDSNSDETQFIIIRKTKPDEIYNLAAQSHVAVSFEVPEYTANADALGALRILEAIKFHKMEKYTKFYQAGTSEMYGNVQLIPQNEKTDFYPFKSIWSCKVVWPLDYKKL